MSRLALEELTSESDDDVDAKKEEGSRAACDDAEALEEEEDEEEADATRSDTARGAPKKGQPQGGARPPGVPAGLFDDEESDDEAAEELAQSFRQPDSEGRGKRKPRRRSPGSESSWTPPGRRGRRRPKRKKACHDSVILAGEIPWPKKRKVQRRKSDGTLASQDEEEDSMESVVRRARDQDRFLAEMRASAAKSKARLAATSSMNVDVKAVKEAALAPSLSFDLDTVEMAEEDSQGSLLEVLPPEGVCKRALLRERLEKQVRRELAKGLVVPSAGPKEATTPAAAAAPPAAPAADVSQERVQNEEAAELEEELSVEEEEEQEVRAEAGEDSSASEDVAPDWFDVNAWRRVRKRTARQEARETRQHWRQKLKDAKTLGDGYIDTILSKEDYIRFRSQNSSIRKPCDGQQLDADKPKLWRRGDEDDLLDFYGVQKKKAPRPSFLTAAPKQPAGEATGAS